MFCRHCLRRRHIAHENLLYSTADVELALQYVREHPAIRDVLITGGDSFCLPDRRLDQILTSLDEIEHVEIKRLGTRTLAFEPEGRMPFGGNQPGAHQDWHHPVLCRPCRADVRLQS